MLFKILLYKQILKLSNVWSYIMFSIYKLLYCMYVCIEGLFWFRFTMLKVSFYSAIAWCSELVHSLLYSYILVYRDAAILEFPISKLRDKKGGPYFRDKSNNPIFLKLCVRQSCKYLYFNFFLPALVSVSISWGRERDDYMNCCTQNL